MHLRDCRGGDAHSHTPGGKLPGSHQNKIQLAGARLTPVNVLFLQRGNKHLTGKPVGSGDAVAGGRECWHRAAGERDLPRLCREHRIAPLSHTGLPRAYRHLPFTQPGPHHPPWVSGLCSKAPQGICLRLGAWVSAQQRPLSLLPRAPWAWNHLCLQPQHCSTYFVPRSCQLLSVGRNVQCNEHSASQKAPKVGPGTAGHRAREMPAAAFWSASHSLRNAARDLQGLHHPSVEREWSFLLGFL